MTILIWTYPPTYSCIIKHCKPSKVTGCFQIKKSNKFLGDILLSSVLVFVTWNTAILNLFSTINISRWVSVFCSSFSKPVESLQLQIFIEIIQFHHNLQNWWRHKWSKFSQEPLANNKDQRLPSHPHYMTAPGSILTPDQSSSGGHLGGGDTQKVQNPFGHRTLKKFPSSLRPSAGPVF